MFIKQYPRLCFKVGISRVEIKRTFARCERELNYFKSLTKECRELFYRGVLAGRAFNRIK
ncbi:hypothetical protein I9Y31_000489 [Clostridium perfringens]|nr:hypothetical protein [Clostridium perfringens]